VVVEESFRALGASNTYGTQLSVNHFTILYCDDFVNNDDRRWNQADGPQSLGEGSTPSSGTR